MSESQHRSRVRSTSGTITFVIIAGQPWPGAEEARVRFAWGERRQGSLTIQTLRIIIPGMQVVIGPQDLEEEGDKFGGQER